MKRLDDLLMERIDIGKISNSHGINGEVKLFPYTNLSEVIFALDNVLLFHPEKKKFFFSKVIEVKPSNKLYILRFQGVETISEAKNLQGFEVYIDKKEMPEIEDSEYYIYELIGMLVKYEDGEIVGEVKDIMQTKANDILMIEKKVTEYKSEETLIPLIQNFIVEMDKKNNIIIAKRMEWMEDETQDKD